MSSIHLNLCWCGDEYSNIYWKCRFNPLSSNDEALPIVLEILEKLKTTTRSALLAKEETNTHIKSEAASYDFTQTEGSESSRDLLQRMEEKGGKKRGCWGAWWFCRLLAGSLDLLKVACSISWEFCCESDSLRNRSDAAINRPVFSEGFGSCSTASLILF